MKAARLLPALTLFAAPAIQAAPPLDGAEAAPTRIQLPSGLTAHLWEEHEAALIRMEGLLAIHPEDIPAHLPGLPTLLLALMEASPKGNRSAAEFQSLLDRSGLRMELALDPQGLRLSVACRSRDQELAFGLLGDLLGRSPLAPEALEPQRTRLAHRPLPEEAGEAFLRRVSGSILAPPSEATLARATFPDLLALLTRIRRPDRLRLHIQGDLNPAQATQRLLLDLGAWSPAGMEPLAAPASAPPSTKLERPGPGELLVAFPPLPPEQAATALLEILLAPRLEGQGEPGAPWRLHLQAESPQAALSALDARLASLTFTNAELKAAKTFWKGRQALLPLDPGNALRLRLRGLPTAEAVERLTRDELEASLKALLGRGHRQWRGEAAWLKAVP